MTDHPDTHRPRRRKVRAFHIIIALLLVLIGAFVLFRIRTKSKLQSRLDAIRAAGYPVTLEELGAWYSIPADSANAADVMIDAFAYYNKWDGQDTTELPVVGKADLPDLNQPMPDQMKALIAEYLRDNKDALVRLHEAAAIEHSRYFLDFSQGFAILLPDLGDIRQGARLLGLEAILHAENSQPQLAVDSATAIFGVSRSLDKEPILISQLVRIACQRLAILTIERILNRTEISDQQMIEMSHLLMAAERSKSLSRGLIGVRCSGFEIMLDPGNNYLSAVSGYSFPTLLVVLSNVTGITDSQALFYLDYVTGFIQAMELEPHRRQAAAATVAATVSEIPRYHALLRMFIPALSRAITLDLKCLAAFRSARVALAVQRYRQATGNLPDALGDLVPAYLDAIVKDPFDGKPLRYKKLEAGFVVYSVDEDGNDDGGKTGPPRNKRDYSVTYDLTFTVQR